MAIGDDETKARWTYPTRPGVPGAPEVQQGETIVAWLQDDDAPSEETRWTRWVPLPAWIGLVVVGVFVWVMVATAIVFVVRAS